MTQPVQLYAAPQQDEERSLQKMVDNALQQYFRNLNGMSPSPNMYDAVMQQVEKPLLENVLRYVRGNQVRAASILGINRNTLRKKITTLDINLNHLSSF